VAVPGGKVSLLHTWHVVGAEYVKQVEDKAANAVVQIPPAIIKFALQ
jgi:hypothetical protein